MILPLNTTYKKSKRYPTGNSHTIICIPDNWTVIDIGSGHNPHQRANILLDKFIDQDHERGSQNIKIPNHVKFIEADACNIPLPDKSVDFAICSHVAEHIENIDAFCNEIIRVAKGGYIETPSAFAEKIRHANNHRWAVSVHNESIKFKPISKEQPCGWVGKLFFSLYFYKSPNIIGRDCFKFANGVNPPVDKLLGIQSFLMKKMWLKIPKVTYTRYLWKDSFTWKVYK